MEAIPVDVRKRVMVLYERGKQTGEIADGFGYCVAARGGAWRPSAACDSTCASAARCSRRPTAAGARASSPPSGSGGCATW